MNCTMGADVVATELSEERKREAEIEAGLREEEPTFLTWMKEGPGKLVSWLGNNEIQVGDTVVSTSAGKLGVKVGTETPTGVAATAQEGADWFGSLPTAVKFGVPALALFLLLRK